MNVQQIRLRLNNLNKDLQTVWQKFRSELNPEKGSQKRVMSEDEKLDEEGEESFPASDPPGHFSKSAEDRELH